MDKKKCKAIDLKDVYELFLFLLKVWRRSENSCVTRKYINKNPSSSVPNNVYQKGGNFLYRESETLG